MGRNGHDQQGMGRAGHEHGVWQPPLRFLPGSGAGLSHAENRQEALSAWCLNLLCLLGIGAGLGLLALEVIEGLEAFPVVTVLAVAYQATVWSLNAFGRLELARNLVLFGTPPVAGAVLGLGIADTGAFVYFPTVVLLPMALSERHTPCTSKLGLMTAGLGGAATWLGTGGNELAALMTFTATVAAVALAYVSCRRQTWTRDDLEQALGALEQAERTRDTLLANVSHELRTPASISLRLLEELNEETLPADASSQIKEARLTLSHGVDVLGDLVDLVSLRDGDVTITPRAVELGRVVELGTWAARKQAQERGLTFSTKIGPNVGIRSVDPERLAQVLRHLTSNAVKYTTEGEVEISIRAESENWVGIEVRDSGPGLDPEQVRMLTGAFVQGDTGLARRSEGLGVGLTLISAIVRAMDGQLGVSGTRGEGTVFLLSVPAPTVGRAKTVVDHLQGWRVLVVDDLLLNRRVLSRLVERLGGEVVEACGGEEAVRCCAEQSFDLVLMDMQMPEVDGPEATRRIRAARCSTPIIAVTANTAPDARRIALASGMDGFLTKPLRGERLLEMMATLDLPRLHAEA